MSLQSAMRLLVLLSLVAGVSACASRAVTRFHTLLPPAAAPATSDPSHAIEVLPVTVPEQVDLPQLVVRSGSGELTIVETRQWAAPLGRELRAALSDGLVAQLGVRDVHRLAVAPELPVWRIKLSVARFDSALGSHALLDAGWSVEGADTVLTCHSRVRQDVGVGFDALVQGHQQAIAQLTAQIATAIGQLQAGAPAACPRA